jgi:hypothetical protein
VRDELYDRGRIDPARLRPLARLAGDYYAHLADIFAMRRPVVPPADGASRPPSASGERPGSPMP